MPAARNKLQKWHDFHNNPADDLVLLSSDGVSFRAPSYRLKGSSGFFDDMLSLQGVGSDAEVIEVDAGASSLQLFLDLISSSEKTKVSLPWSEYSVCFEVLELARRFDCKTLEGRILAAVDLSAQTPEGYWKLLVKISHQNDFMLGRAALRQLNRSRVIGKPIWDRLKNLDVIWFWYIRNALFAESGGPGTTPQRHLKLNSIPNKSHPHVEWIDQFDPYGRQEEWGSDIENVTIVLFSQWPP